MSAHTPGPWSIHRHSETSVVAPAGYVVAACGGHTNNTIDPEALQSELIANARLIAAAPDLRDELINLTARFKAAVMQAGTDEEFAELAVASARAAIAKATGSAS